jgi:hypothetical protein
MSNDKAEPIRNTDVATTNDKQTIEPSVSSVPTPPDAVIVRPWTADFLLPSIRFREPSPPKSKLH